MHINIFLINLFSEYVNIGVYLLLLVQIRAGIRWQTKLRKNKKNKIETTPPSTGCNIIIFLI